VLCCAAGIPELVAKLQSQGKNVFLVSGGFRQVIHPIAESLNIPVSNVHANNLLFKVRRALPVTGTEGFQHIICHGVATTGGRRLLGTCILSGTIGGYRVLELPDWLGGDIDRPHT
jgi:hypothetical protein